MYFFSVCLHVLLSFFFSFLFTQGMPPVQTAPSSNDRQIGEGICKLNLVQLDIFMSFSLLAFIINMVKKMCGF